MNDYFVKHMKLGEGDRVKKWWRRKLLQFSVVLPYQDLSQLLNVLQQLMEEEEKEQPQASIV